MNNTPSLNEINKFANMDPNLLIKHYQLKHMNDFMSLKYQNPKMKQSEIADQLSVSTSSIQRCRKEINMRSPYRTITNTTKKRQKMVKNTDFDNNLQHERGSERPQLTTNNLKRPQTSSNKTKTRNNLKGGSISVEENVEINEHYLDKILKNNNN